MGDAVYGLWTMDYGPHGRHAHARIWPVLRGIEVRRGAWAHGFERAGKLDGC